MCSSKRDLDSRAGVSVLIVLLVWPPPVHAEDANDSEATGAAPAERLVIDVTLSQGGAVEGRLLPRISHHFFESSRFGGTWGRERESFGRSGGESALS